MNSRKLLKEFHKLDKKEQNEIRSSYKKNHPKEYYYSIRLFILYSIVGVVGILGLFLDVYYGKINGLYMYFFSILLLVLCVLLLNQSNEPFYKYLENKLKKKD